MIMIDRCLNEVILNNSLRASNELQYAYVTTVLRYIDGGLDEAYEHCVGRGVNYMLAYTLVNDLVHKEIPFPHTIEEAIVVDRVHN